MAAPLIIVGDVHLDGGDNAFHAFLDALAVRPPGHLVILGDLFEYWLDTAASAARGARCSRQLVRLRRQGWRLDLILGNREMGAGRRLAIATCCRLHWPGLRLRLGPALIHIVHGDRLCADPGHRFLIAHMRAFWVQALLRCAPEWLLELGGRWARRGSRARQARRDGEPRRGPRVDLEARRVLRAGRGAQSLVAGHIHDCWRGRVAGVDLLLVGDWTVDEGSWVLGHADGRLEQVRHDFRLGPPPV